jgi:hypothetical protein
MVPKNGAEERGCAFTVKTARIYVHVQLQRNSSSTRVVNTRPWIFEISAWRRIFWEIFAMVAQCMEDKRTAPLTCTCQWIREGAYLWWYMWGCVRSEAAQRKHKGTSFARAFRSRALMTAQKHWYLGWGTWLSWKNDAFARMVHEIYEVLLRTHQTPEQTPSQSAFSAFLPCPHNCIFEDSAGHNGPARARKTNLSVLASETMWYQPIFIELLAVLLLLQEHMHFPFPTSRHFPLTTYLKSSCTHSHFTTRNGHEILRKC